jgi:phospholipase/carboxylesterase
MFRTVGRAVGWAGGNWRGGVAAEARQGRLTARPPRRPRSGFTAGLERLQADGGAGGLLYVPAGLRPELPAPLVLLLHGAGTTARHGLELLVGQADDAGLVLLAPSSQGETWDRVLGGYGPDVAWIDQALAEAFQRLPVDPSRLAVAGFSDGASYAISLGLTNGDLFSHILAFSPGFAAPARRHGHPRLFVSHGTRPRAANRCLQPQAGARTTPGRLPGALPRVRRRARHPGRHHPGGGGLVSFAGSGRHGARPGWVEVGRRHPFMVN